MVWALVGRDASRVAATINDHRPKHMRLSWEASLQAIPRSREQLAQLNEPGSLADVARLINVRVHSLDTLQVKGGTFFYLFLLEQYDELP